MGEFDDKVAIVTGSGGGIGQAYAEALAREGAAVVVADINSQGGQAVAKQINADGGTALYLLVDVADPASAKAMADRTLAEFGGIDYLVNNAAIYGGMKLDFLLTVDPAVQRQRLLAREGASRAERFLSLWLPLEAAYFSSFDPKDRADLVLDTSDWSKTAPSGDGAPT